MDKFLTGDRGRRKSKFQLRQRLQANGLKAQRQHLCKNADEVQVIKIKNKSINNLPYNIIKDIFISLKLLVDMVIEAEDDDDAIIDV